MAVKAIFIQKCSYCGKYKDEDLMIKLHTTVEGEQYFCAEKTFLNKKSCWTKHLKENK